MRSRGFVSLLVLVWFCGILAFLGKALNIIDNQLQSLGNLKTIKARSQLEFAAIKEAKQRFLAYDEENYCDFYGEYEVCFRFLADLAVVEIDYLAELKTLYLTYDSGCACFSQSTSKVDK